MLAVILALTSLWSGNIHSISQKRHTCTGFHLRYQWHILRSHIISGTHEAHSRVIVQFSSVTQSCPTLCDPMNRSRPGLPVHHQLSEFTQTQSIESVMPSSHLILCRPLSSCPQSLPASAVSPEVGAVTGRDHKEGLGGPGRVLFLDIGAGYTCVFSLWKFIELKAYFASTESI